MLDSSQATTEPRQKRETMARRRYQRGSVFLRGQVWVGRWMEDVRDANNNVRRVRRAAILGTKDSLATKRLAQRELEKRVAPINAMEYTPRTEITFGQFIERWKTHMLPNYKPSTRMELESRVQRHIEPYFSEMKLYQIRNETIQRFITDKLQADLSPARVRALVMTIKAIWRTVKEWEYSNHDLRFTLPKSENFTERRFFTEEEVKRILEAADEPWKTLYWLVGQTGMRIGEALALRGEDFDFDRRLVTIRRAVWHGHISTPKTSKGIRVLDLSPGLVDRLKGIVKPGEYVFHAELLCKPYNLNTVLRDRLYPLLDRLGIPRGGFHAFRHMNATMMDRLGAPTEVRKDRLGHTDMATTGIYQHLVREDARRVALEIDSLIVPNCLKSVPLLGVN